MILQLHRFVQAWLCKPGRSRSLANPCFTKGEVYLYAASELANTNSASKMTCRHMMTSQFRSRRRKEPFGKPNGEKTGDFKRFLPFFRPCIFSEFHRSLLPLSVLCLDSNRRNAIFDIDSPQKQNRAQIRTATHFPKHFKKLLVQKIFTKL